MGADSDERRYGAYDVKEALSHNPAGYSFIPLSRSGIHELEKQFAEMQNV